MANETDHAVATSSSCGRYLIRSLFITVVVFLTLLFSANTRADFQPLTLPELFEKSDLIVLGVIESFDDNNFTLRQTEVYFGNVGSTPIRVKKYMDWPGGLRWSSYRTGQSVLLFLSRPTTDDGIAGEPWRIRGLGGEGEMPIDDRAIFVHGVNLKDFKRQRHQIENSTLYSYRFETRIFTSALKGYLRCYVGATTGKSDESGGTVSRCSDQERLIYRESSRLHWFLAKSKEK